MTLSLFHGINAMILMPQIFDVIANENAPSPYKRNELQFSLSILIAFSIIALHFFAQAVH